MLACRVCCSRRLRFIADFGRLAVTNQFVMEGGIPAYRHPMSWHQCLDCGVVQLSHLPPIEQIRCRFPWLSYREPERHLDKTAEVLVRILGPQKQARMVGLTKDDEPLMKRLSPHPSVLIDPAHDLAITDHSFGVETIQSHWKVECSRRAAEKYGKADVLVARYLLEHAHDASGFLAACRAMLADDGILVIEVPDCAQALREIDVTVLWEEHALYFTEASLKRCLIVNGFAMLDFQRVPDPMEDRLIWIGRPAGSSPIDQSSDAGLETDSEILQFASKWPQRRQVIRSWAESIQRDAGRLAVFGAGHRACTLIDATNIVKFVDCIVDDTKEKQQLRFPAGELPIYGSAALVDRGITCCLLVVNPEVEDRIIERNSPFVAAGGTFVSCYARSSRALGFS